MRVDKFLKVSRIIKRRTSANAAADNGRILVNGRTVKPSYQLKEGDIVTVAFGGGNLTFKVKLLKETVKKEEASLLYEILP